MPPAAESDRRDLERLGAQFDSLRAQARRLGWRLTASLFRLRRQHTREHLRRLGVSSAAELDPTWGALARRLRALRERRK